ncbi:hypothetical protein OU798_02235 [Prolixibacteraceae bacterium Z1-6]|uniref:DUF7847 domain-containing protein n=1 Tax=Draconibacterium aestuarii TaxID=2998507 RepID=A0A9X3F283_9BACT|nr:hypothetical protein [Prolixibacteraceae bacterium Z1-6]
MEQKEIQFRKKRELGVIISDSFEFLKLEIKPISRLILIYVLPFVVLYAFGQVYLQRNVLSAIDLTDQEKLMANIGPFYLNMFLFLFFGLFIQSLLVGTYYSYIEAYLKLGKGNFNLSDISAKFFANSLLAMGANLVFAVIVFFGIIMCFLPGIYFANTFSLLLIIFIYEKKGLGDALSRSWKLVNTQWWNTLILNLLAIVMIWAVSMLISIPTMVMGISKNLFSSEFTNPVDYPQWYWIVTGITAAVSTLLMIIPFTFQAFQYFNLEERENPTINLNDNSITE